MWFPLDDCPYTVVSTGVVYVKSAQIIDTESTQPFTSTFRITLPKTTDSTYIPTADVTRQTGIIKEQVVIKRLKVLSHIKKAIAT